MNFIDSHTHAYMLSGRDLELMGLSGVNTAVLCSFVPVAKYAETLMDHFTELDTVHRARLSEYGITAHIFVGIHPRCIPEEWRRLLPIIGECIEAGKAKGIGEIGLEKANETEIEVLKEQLILAREYDVPVIVHIPMQNRAKITDKILSMANEVGMDLGKLVVDHTDDDTIDLINEANAVPGLSVKPGLLTPEKIATNIDKYRNGLLNSDCASLTNTDPLAVPKTARHLMKAGIEKAIVERLSNRNAQNILKG
ncbi:TatD family hydrolase [Archaeoglobus veneficus]|nr:TatD family hydrolase [Archaeoglobus veneficus]